MLTADNNQYVLGDAEEEAGPARASLSDIDPAVLAALSEKQQKKLLKMYSHELKSAAREEAGGGAEAGGERKRKKEKKEKKVSPNPSPRTPILTLARALTPTLALTYARRRRRRRRRRRGSEAAAAVGRTTVTETLMAARLTRMPEEGRLARHPCILYQLHEST